MLTYKQFHVTHAKVWIGHSEKAERICVKTKTGTAGRKYSRERERPRAICKQRLEDR